MKFKGFPEGKADLTPIPGLFFEELLHQIDHLGELKLTLYTFWRLDHIEGTFRCLRRDDFAQDEQFMRDLGGDASSAQEALDEALQRAVQRGTLLQVKIDQTDGIESYYFLNSPKGRAAERAIQSGEWQPPGAASSLPAPQRPNIFRLYEENIGPLTPLLAEALGEAEDTYPATWIEEAIQIAVKKDKRHWRYIQAILERWLKEDGDGKKIGQKDRRDTTQDRHRYVEGEFSDFID